MTEYTAQQIVDFLKSGDGPGSLFTSSQLAEQLAAKHVEARDMMTRLQSAMNEAWSGDAAGQAQAGAGPLLAASEVSAVHLSAAQSALLTQGSDYADLKNKVGDGPGPQPGEDFLSRHLPMLTNKDEEIAGWNAKAQEVVRHYGTYHGQSTDNTAGLPRDYGELTLPSGGADIEHAEQPPAVVPPGGHDKPPAVVPPGGRDHQRAVADRPTPAERRGTDVPGQDASGQQQRPAVEPATRDTAGTTGPGQDHPTGTTVPVGQDDATRTSGLAPASPGDSATGNLPGGGFGRDGGSGDINARLGPGPGFTEAGGPGGEPGGRGGVGEPGGRGGDGRLPRGGVDESGGRGGDGRLPRGGVGESGGRSGTGRWGEPGAARPGTLRGGTGKPGAPGLGGPLGQGGRKEEDKEHKRLGILREPDPDEVFGGYPDGMKPVPPTIGA